jgi:translation elongation factor P/translation initiation factor 5A
MYNASDLRKGLKIQIDNEPYIVKARPFTAASSGI